MTLCKFSYYALCFLDYRKEIHGAIEILKYIDIKCLEIYLKEKYYLLLVFKKWSNF